MATGAARGYGPGMDSIPPNTSGASAPRADLLTGSPVYKPFRYPWAYEAWMTQQRVHWLPEEVPLADDVKDWHRNLSAGEQNLVTQIFRFFTQSDVEVNNCYMKHYSQVFKPNEVLMMLSAFSNIETIHIAAYSHLLDTIGMPEVEYSAFLKYKEMKDKYDYMQGFSVANKREIAKTLAAFGAFTEGLQLFASFAILLNFPRFNKLKGMGQIGAQVKAYIRFIADRRLTQLGLDPLYNIESNPLPWVDDMLNAVEHANFFENRATEYSRASTLGTWEEAFENSVFEHT